MPTPEQQPNTSNLQSLESELSLTKQELDEFRKLPKEEQERQKDEKLLELQRLNDKLDVVMQEAIRTGHLDEAIKLKEQLEKEVNDLGEKVEMSESPFDPERDITEEDWQEMIEPLDKNHSWGKYNWQDISRAAALKVLRPSLNIDFNILNWDEKFKELEDLGKKGEGWGLAQQAADIKIIRPKMEMVLDDACWDAMREQLEKCRRENNWTGFAQQASNMKILDPSYNLNINEYTWEGMNNVIEDCRLKGKIHDFAWATFSRQVEHMKIINSNFDFKLTETDWQGLKNWLKEDKSGRAWRLMEMKILAAEVVEVTDEGLKIQMIKGLNS